MERIKQGLANKRVANPELTGKGENAVLWRQMRSLMARHPTMPADQIAKVADLGVATVYKIKVSSPKPYNAVIKIK